MPNGGPYYHEDREKKRLKKMLARHVTELDAAIALLSGTLRELTRSTTNRPGMFDAVPGLEEWWVRHQKSEALREERKRKRREKAAAKKQDQ